MNLGKAYVEVGADTRTLTTSLRQAHRETEKAVDKMSGLFGSLRSAIGRAGKAVFSLQGAFASLGAGLVAHSLFEAGRGADQLNRSFKAVFGTTQAASKEFRFLRDVSESLGQNFYELAGAYKGIAAAAKDTALEGDKLHKIFQATVEGATALGLSMEDTKGILYALNQMISKGTVQAEELRGQLGERLPGAFQLAAKALGVTTAQLGKMLEQGQVLSEDLLPKLADLLHEKYGKAASEAADSATAAVNRFQEAWMDVKVAIAESGFMDVMVGSMRDISSWMSENQAEIREWAEVLMGALKEVFNLLEGIANLLKTPMKLVIEIAEETRKNLALLPFIIEQIRKQAEGGATFESGLSALGGLGGGGEEMFSEMPGAPLAGKGPSPERVKQFWRDMADAITGPLSNLADFLTKYTGGQALQRTVDEILAGAKQAKEAAEVADELNDLIAGMEEGWKKIESMPKSLGKVSVTAVTPAVPYDVMEEALWNTARAIERIMAEVDQATSDALVSMAAAWDEVDQLSEKGRTATQEQVDALGRAFEDATDKVFLWQKGFEDAWDAVDELSTEGQRGASQALQALQVDVDSALAQVDEWIASMEAAWKEVDKLSSTGRSATQDAIQMLINQVNAQLQVVDKAASIVARLKGLLGQQHSAIDLIGKSPVEQEIHRMRQYVDTLKEAAEKAGVLKQVEEQMGKTFTEVAQRLEQLITIKGYAKLTDQFEKLAKKQEEIFGKEEAQRDLSDYEKALADINKKYDEMLDKYGMIAGAAEKIAKWRKEEIHLLNLRVAGTAITGPGEDLAAIADEIEGDLSRAAEQYQNDWEAINEEIEAHLDRSKDVEDFWLEAGRNLQANLSDIFYDIMSGADTAFEGIAQSWMRLISNMLGKMATSGLSKVFDSITAGTFSMATFGKDLAAGLAKAGPMLAIAGGLQTASSAAHGNWANVGGSVLGAGAGLGIGLALGASNPMLLAALGLGAMFGGDIFGSLFGGLFGGKEPQNITTTFKKGPPGPVSGPEEPWLEVARRGEVQWDIGSVQEMRRMVPAFFEDLGDIMQGSFQDILSDHTGWKFRTEDVESVQEAFRETAGQIIQDFGAELFGPDSIFAQGLPDEWWAQWAKPGEDANDVIVRFADSLGKMKKYMEDVDDTIAVMTAHDFGFTQFSVQAKDLDDRIAKLGEELKNATDPTDALLYAQELEKATVDRYNLEMEYIEKLYDQIQTTYKAYHNFLVRIDSKIDAVTGSSTAFADVWGYTVDRWNAFLNETDPDRKIALLQEVEEGLDTAYQMQRDLAQAEIDRLEAVMQALDRLRDLSVSLSEKIGEGAGAYADLVGFAMDQAYALFDIYKAIPPEDVQRRAELIQGMVEWIDKAVAYATARWNAYYDALVEEANKHIDKLREAKEDIQEQIQDQQDLKKEIKDSYQEQIDALREQVDLAKAWKRVLDSVSDQILRIRTTLSNQQDIFERMAIMRSEIARVQGLYAGATGEEKIQYATQLSSMYEDLLRLGQEAWQRPSPQYQALYEEVLSGLEAIQSDAEAQAGDTLSVEEKIKDLTEEMNDELASIDDTIDKLRERSDRIDEQIKGYREDIARYNKERQATLDAIQEEAAGYYEYLRNEANNINAEYREPTKTALEQARDHLEEIDALYVEYLGYIRDYGSIVYRGQLAAMEEALRRVIGPGTLSGHIKEMEVGLGTALGVINGTLQAIGQGMGITGFAEGGIVTRPTLALVGERGPEAIIPLRKGYAPALNVNITINGGRASADDIGDAVIRKIEKAIAYGSLRRTVQRVAVGA